MAAAPARYASSPEAKRGFCPTGGTQICFTASFIPGLIDIAIGSLDQPDAISPTLHCCESQRVPWVRITDDLPRFSELPPVA